MKRLAAKPSFRSFSIFNPDLTAVHLLQVKLRLNKPIFIGFSVLELSKTLMYSFDNDYMRPKYGEQAKSLFTDTDS